MKKILFLAPHRPGRSPGQRFRFEQYLDYLRENDFQCDLSWIISEKDDRSLYKRGYYFRKLFIFIKSVFIRHRDLRRAHEYDFVFVYRESVLHGSSWFERRLSKKTKLVFDFDDAIWLRDVSEGNKNLAWLKRPAKTASIIRNSWCTITGNAFLANYARQFSRNTVVFPTTIDISKTEGFLKNYDSEKIIIGWTGSMTTLKHLNEAVPFIRVLQERFPGKIQLLVIADRKWESPGIASEFVYWNAETELRDLGRMDIGIMPLPDDEWSRGKCGFKGLQYMALGIPTLMSPVGVNCEIISHGENGFLCKNQEEWISCMELLILSPSLRKKLGENGRKTVAERYSLQAKKTEYLRIFSDKGDAHD